MNSSSASPAPCKNENKEERIRAARASDSLTDIFGSLRSSPMKVTISQDHGIANPNDNQFSSESPEQMNPESSDTIGLENNSETKRLTQIPEAIFTDPEQQLNPDSLFTTVQKSNATEHKGDFHGNNSLSEGEKKLDI